MSRVFISSLSVVKSMYEEETLYYRLRYIIPPMVGEEGPALFLDGHSTVTGLWMDIRFVRFWVSRNYRKQAKYLGAGRSEEAAMGMHFHSQLYFFALSAKCMQRDDEEWVVVART